MQCSWLHRGKHAKCVDNRSPERYDLNTKLDLSWNIGLKERDCIWGLCNVSNGDDILAPRWRIPYSGMLRRVALVRTDVSEESITSLIKVKIIGPRNNVSSHIVFHRSVLRLLVTVNGVPSSPILATLMMEVIRSSETSILTRTTQCNNLENGILRSRRRENLKSYTQERGLSLFGCQKLIKYIRCYLPYLKVLLLVTK
jgi:hypothetical protein